jgi:hypothetical protein
MGPRRTQLNAWFVICYHVFLPLKPNDIAAPGARGNAEGNKWPRKHPIQPLSSCSPGSARTLAVIPDKQRSPPH